VNCWVEATFKSAGDAGVTAMADNVGGAVVGGGVVGGVVGGGVVVSSSWAQPLKIKALANITISGIKRNLFIPPPLY